MSTTTADVSRIHEKIYKFNYSHLIISFLPGRLQRTSSTPFNPRGCVLSTHSALLTARSRSALKCPVVIGFGLVCTLTLPTEKLSVRNNKTKIKFFKAIWMLPTENRFGLWPRSGEIDIVEIRSNENLVCQDRHVGNKLMGSTLHFGIIYLNQALNQSFLSMYFMFGHNRH